MVICDPQLLHERSTRSRRMCTRVQCAELDSGTSTRALSLQGLRHAPIWRRIGPNGPACPRRVSPHAANLRTSPPVCSAGPAWAATPPADTPERLGVPPFVGRPRARGPAFLFRCTPPIHMPCCTTRRSPSRSQAQWRWARPSPRHAIGAARCGPARCGMPPGPLGAGHA